MKNEPPESGTRPMPTKPGMKARRLRRETQVARARQRDPRARAGAVDRGDHGLLERADGEDVRVVGRAEHVRDGARAFPEVAEILAGAEAPACACDHDRADLGVARLGEPGGEPGVNLALNAFSESGRLSVSVRTAPSREDSTSDIAQTLLHPVLVATQLGATPDHHPLRA